jgi:hypothetical protein
MNDLKMTISVLIEEKLTGLSNDLLARYKSAAGKQASAADKENTKAATDLATKRFKGIVKATNKQFINFVL